VRPLLLTTVAVLLAACSGPILANPPAARPVVPPERPATSRPPDPQPVSLPADDAPHDRLTEWWYYTGHLRDARGRRWGFEYVIFRAERGGFPVSWASHLALTDETGSRFTYAQRTEIGPQVDTSAPESFAFRMTGFDPTRSAVGGAAPWEMAGTDGSDRLVASVAASETQGDQRAFRLDLLLRATRPATLHDEDGWVDFGPAGGSYYYSRTRMSATGSLVVDGRRLDVEGLAWFDHQWGDFIAVGGGGWDWFAINLDDGSDLSVSLVRARDGSYPLVYGTLVQPDGTIRHLPRDSLRWEVTRAWVSARTGARYPAGWRIEVPDEQLVVHLTPSVADQELDTRATTGVVYWEGSQEVSATRAGRPLGGEAYVELTGYLPPDGKSPSP